MRQFTFIRPPRSFIETERLFEHEKVRKIKAFFCVVAMLPDYLFLKCTFGLCHPPLRWQLLQFSEILYELCFDSLIRLHVVFLSVIMPESITLSFITNECRSPLQVVAFSLLSST
jgi:hypothetical protein